RLPPGTSPSELPCPRSSSPGGGSMTSLPPARSTSTAIGATKGTSTSERRVVSSAGVTASRLWPWCSTPVTVPTSSPETVTTVRPVSWWSWNSSGSSGGGTSAVWIVSQAPRSNSASVRSATPAKLTSSRPECQREDSTVSGPALAGSVPSTEPAAKRCSGSSVRTSTESSPRSPCGLRIRPTTRDSSIALQHAARPPHRAPGPAARGAGAGGGRRRGPAAKPPGAASSSRRGVLLPDLVHVQQIDSHVPAAGQGPDDGTQGPGGAPAPADHLAQVVRVHADLEDPAPAKPVAGDADVVGVIHDALDQVLERFLEHLRPRCPARPAALGPRQSPRPRRCPLRRWRRQRRRPWRPRPCPWPRRPWQRRQPWRWRAWPRRAWPRPPPWPPRLPWPR